MIRLTSVDLPTFGRPTTATTGGVARSVELSDDKRTSLITLIDVEVAAQQEPRALAVRAPARVVRSSLGRPTRDRPAGTARARSTLRPRPCGEASPNVERPAVRHRPRGSVGDGPGADRGGVDRAPIQRDLADMSKEPTKQTGEQLMLREGECQSRSQRHQHRAVKYADVIGGQDGSTGTWHVFLAM